jgi:osmotically-inducible protein OsmY
LRIGSTDVETSLTAWSAVSKTRVGKGVGMGSTAAGSGASTRVEFPDGDVQQRVRTFLNTRHFPAFRRLHVDVENGAVRLSGSVPSFYEKQVAISSCQRVAGVLQLIDAIIVEGRPAKG